MLTSSRLRHVVDFQESLLCLSVLPQRAQLLFQELAERTKVLTRSRLRHVVHV